MSGGGPNHAIFYNRATITGFELRRIMDAEREFWAARGFPPQTVEFVITKPSYTGLEPVTSFRRNGTPIDEVSITRETLERLLFAAMR